MDSVKFDPGPLCLTLPRPAGGPLLKRLYGHFRSRPPAGRVTCRRLLSFWKYHLLLSLFPPVINFPWHNVRRATSLGGGSIRRRQSGRRPRRRIQRHKEEHRVKPRKRRRLNPNILKLEIYSAAEVFSSRRGLSFLFTVVTQSGRGRGREGRIDLLRRTEKEGKERSVGGRGEKRRRAA
jgi:hypothetical protein